METIERIAETVTQGAVEIMRIRAYANRFMAVSITGITALAIVIVAIVIADSYRNDR